MVAVTDDGRGLADAEASTGFESMKARAEQLGARLRIAGGTERGTVVELELPLRPAQIPPAALRSTSRT
jgi:signal transduction histidine kinase